MSIGRLLLLVILLSGCEQSGPAGDLDEYLGKLERVLEQGAHRTGDYPVLRMPDVRDLALPALEDSIDVVEFLKLRPCKLHQLVAERNSVLGKLAEPSQRLIYELQFLDAAEDCLSTLATDQPELVLALREVVTRKQAQLPAVIFAATLGGDEFRQFWQPRNDALPDTVMTGGSLTPAISQLSRQVRNWLAGDYAIDGARLEGLLDVIRRGDGGMQMMAWMLIGSRLDVATGVLNDRLQRQPLCFEGMDTPTADIFEAVVKDMLIGRIQPFIARLNSRYYELLPGVRVLEHVLAGAEPAAYAEWRKQRDADLEQARTALPRHVAALNVLFEQCNLIPTRGIAGI